MWSREGFTVDVLGRATNRTLLNPWLTTPLWLSLVCARRFHAFGSYDNNTTDVLETAVFLLGLIGFVSVCNASLNRGFNNNWAPPSNWNWNDEIVFVTGGSSGIGQSICTQLLERNPNTKIVIADIVPLTWSPPLHSSVHFYKYDLSDSTEIKRLCDQVRKEVGDPTVLINNAGLVRGFTVCDGTYADVETTIKTNLMAPFLLVKELLPNMAARNHGHIVNISSMSALIPPAGVADYAATKAGLIALHEVSTTAFPQSFEALLTCRPQALQLELRHVHNAPRVRLSLVILSFVQTPLFKGETRQSNFLTPLMHVESVAEMIVATLYSGYGRTIFLPGIMRYVASLVRPSTVLVENIY